MGSFWSFEYRDEVVSNPAGLAHEHSAEVGLGQAEICPQFAVATRAHGGGDRTKRRVFDYEQFGK